MCGICGIVATEQITNKDRHLIKTMNSLLIHRGPDGEGFLNEKQVMLAMRRLSIIDLNMGWQPLYNEDKTVAVIVNGEIYNYIELRKRLLARGHKFRTNSDCETIAHLYEEYGENCVKFLRGMFAFVLWDGRKNKIIFARDRMGEKPLYLYEQDKKIYFSSELKALLKAKVVPLKLDPVAVNLYFHFQYVPEPYSIVEGVRKLPAGCILTIDLNQWKVKQKKYWSLDEAKPLIGDPVELIRQELDRVGELVIRSDVPVGVSLSGGLDSSVVTALAVKKYKGIIQAFSIGYAGFYSCDERGDAKKLADFLKIPFHDLELRTQDMVQDFPEVVFGRDDPIADIAGYGYFAVMKLAKEHGVKVMLQGQGGDELFWGYPWVRKAVAQSKLKREVKKRGIRMFPSLLKPYFPKKIALDPLRLWVEDGFGIIEGATRFQRFLEEPVNQFEFSNLTPDFRYAKSKMNKIYTPEFAESIKGLRPEEVFTSDKHWQNVEIEITKLICDTYLLENGITQGDRLSATSSVELRLPLVDYRLVETVIGLRKNNNDLPLGPKYWLRQAAADLLPPWVLSRPKKNFSPPVREWHRALFEKYGKKLTSGYLVNNKILDKREASHLATGFFPAHAASPLSFKALTLEIWCQKMG